MTAFRQSLNTLSWSAGRTSRAHRRGVSSQRERVDGVGAPQGGEHRQGAALSELLHALELVHALRSTPAKAAGKPLWPWSRATVPTGGSPGSWPRPASRAPGMPERPPARFRHCGRCRRRPAADDRDRGCPGGTPTCRPPLRASRRGILWPGCWPREQARSSHSVGTMHGKLVRHANYGPFWNHGKGVLEEIPADRGLKFILSATRWS